MIFTRVIYFKAGLCIFVGTNRAVMLCLLLFLESIGTGELMIILLFVLFFFGSKKIPELARGLGKGMREMKDAVQGIQDDIRDGVNLDETKKMVDDVKKDIRSAKDDLM